MSHERCLHLGLSSTEYIEPDFQFTHFAPITDADRTFNAFKRLSCTLLCSASLFIHFELYKKSHSGQRLTKMKNLHQK